MIPDILQMFADWVTYTVLGLVAGTPLASSVNFFIYDSIKVTALLAVIVFLCRDCPDLHYPAKGEEMGRREDRRSGECICGPPWYSYPVLLLFGSPALHWFCRVWCPARDYLLVPHRFAVDQ